MGLIMQYLLRGEEQFYASIMILMDQFAFAEELTEAMMEHEFNLLKEEYIPYELYLSDKEKYELIILKGRDLMEPMYRSLVERSGHAD